MGVARQLLELRIHPGAARERVAGLSGDMVKIELSAPAVEGKANQALIKFLARSLGVPRGTISLARGEKSRTKLIRVEGMPPAEIRRRLLDSGR